GQQGVREYRWALGLGLVALVGLYFLGLITAAIVVAAVLVPVVYVMYLYEARVYRDAPIPVTLLTIGGGILVGLIAALVLDPLLASKPVFIDTLQGPVLDITALLLVSVVLPLVLEVVKPLPALVLRGRPAFGHSIDGIVFGVAAGLGFAAAQTIVHYWPVLSRFGVRSEPGLWLLPVVSIAILFPLLHGTTTGLVAGAIWRLGRAPLSRMATGAIAAAVLGHIAFALGTQLLIAASLHAVIVLAWQAIVVIGLLIAIRLQLDAALREEATAEGLTHATCANCGAAVLAAGFCPACGVAMTATSHNASLDAGAAVSGSAPGGAR
ncbi:MAG TPA: PrsW family glutamic-type intramembrane protease, partial [Nonomuraea sp.]|nr:PrsW family glutamic-type intramembrane protease [Nonomuraea sp.]